MHIHLAAILPLVVLNAKLAFADDPPPPSPPLVPSGPGNGVACQGRSRYCSGDWPRIELVKNDIHSLTDYYSVDDNFVIPPDTNFACNNGYCAAFRNMPGKTTLGVAKRVIDQLYQHGCRGCGVAPVGPGNDNSLGYLEVNQDFHGYVQVDYGPRRPPAA